MIVLSLKFFMYFNNEDKIIPDFNSGFYTYLFAPLWIGQYTLGWLTGLQLWNIVLSSLDRSSPINDAPYLKR